MPRKPRSFIDPDRAENILARLDVYSTIDTHGRPRDEIGWIALAFSCSRTQAEKWIDQARAWKRRQESR